MSAVYKISEYNTAVYKISNVRVQQSCLQDISATFDSGLKCDIRVRHSTAKAPRCHTPHDMIVTAGVNAHDRHNWGQHQCATHRITWVPHVIFHQISTRHTFHYICMTCHHVTLHDMSHCKTCYASTDMQQMMNPPLAHMQHKITRTHATHDSSISLRHAREDKPTNSSSLYLSLPLFSSLYLSLTLLHRALTLTDRATTLLHRTPTLLDCTPRLRCNNTSLQQ